MTTVSCPDGLVIDTFQECEGLRFDSLLGHRLFFRLLIHFNIYTVIGWIKNSVKGWGRNEDSPRFCERP